MPGLSNVFIDSPINSDSSMLLLPVSDLRLLADSSITSFYPIPVEEIKSLPLQVEDKDKDKDPCCQQNHKDDKKRQLLVPISSTSSSSVSRIRSDQKKKVVLGFLQTDGWLPFLVGAPTMGQCRVCSKYVYSRDGDGIICCVRGCEEPYHIACARQTLGFSPRTFKCPQHACFICKQKGSWRCIRCTIASHSKCAPWQDRVNYLNKPGWAVCWRHPVDWRLEKKQNAVPTNDLEEIFSRLPLPYIEEEFRIDLLLKNVQENELEPTPYVHIRRNVYLVKRKRDDAYEDIGCTNCKTSMCSEACVCRGQSISCSKACQCSEMCENRPFRKEKKVNLVKTLYCGWGVEAAESIKEGDFIIEYIGEVIDDALCEKRLWDMKYRGDQNFYMCEIRKDFTIDATFKGNVARFLNHSCDPNCKLEKWQVDGDTRVGVFAARLINIGEPLTYDYRFVHFGPLVKCCCGAVNCQGFLGSKRKTVKVNLCWGSKRRRSSTSFLKL